MKHLLLLSLLIKFASLAFAGDDAQLQLKTVEGEIMTLVQKIVPEPGRTEQQVLEIFGRPNGATTPANEREHGNYDKDGIGVYRWFYRDMILGREEATNLSTTMPVELVIYFIDGRVHTSTIEMSAPTPRIYLSDSGVITSSSGRPPVPRMNTNSGLIMDYFVAEGEVEHRRHLLIWLGRYQKMIETKSATRGASKTSSSSPTLEGDSR